MISPQSCPLLRTRLPSAPAALERVFSSSPLSSSTRGGVALSNHQHHRMHPGHAQRSRSFHAVENLPLQAQ
jgi:hypothetical protein